MDEAWATEGDSSSFPVEAVGDQGKEDEVTALQDFVAGGIAGSASVVVGHPFDTIKVIGLKCCYNRCHSSERCWRRRVSHFLGS
jgi:hypothetical protein